MEITDLIKYDGIDYDIKVPIPEIFILKPNNKEVIATCKDIYGVKPKIKLGNVYELEFKVPIIIEFNHEYITNPNLEYLKEDYLIRFKINNKTELYIINTITDGSDEENDYKIVKCFSYNYKLNDYIIRDYDATGFTLNEIFFGKINYPPELYGENYIPTLIQEKGILYKTNWEVSYIDPIFNNIKLSYKLSNNSTTVLNVVLDIAKLYTAGIEWDTENETIKIKNPESMIYDEGLTFSYGHYLKTLSRESNTNKMVTRLYVYGKDSLDISSVSPAGSNYIESFNYYLFPFERDGNKNIIKHSYFMSDDLCNAILDYENKIELRKEELKTVTENISQLRNELSSLQIDEQEKYQAVIDAQYTHYVKWYSNRVDEPIKAEAYTEEEFQAMIDDTIEWQAVVDTREAWMNAKAATNAKNNEINAQLAIRYSILDDLSEDNNFTVELLEERKRFIREREFEDTNQVDVNSLYERGLKEFNVLQTPEKVINIDIFNFLECIEEQWNWDKLKIGAKVIIRNEIININSTANIVEMEIDYDNNNINLVISSEDNFENDLSKLSEYMNKAISTSIQVERTKPLWEKLEKRESEISDILDKFYDSIYEKITFAVNQSVIIDDMGISIYQLDAINQRTENFLRLTNGALAITNDNGRTYRSAITIDGVIAERLIGRLIVGEKLVLGDPDGILEILGNKGTIVDRFGREVMAFGLYNYDHTTVENVRNPHVDWAQDKFGILLYGKYPSTDPYEHPRTKVVMDSSDGFYIDKWEIFDGTDYDWHRKFYVNDEGSLFSEDMTTYRLQIYQKPGVLLLDADTRLMDIGRMSKFITDNSLTPMEKLQVKAEWTRIESEFLEIQRAYLEHRYSYRDADKSGVVGNIDHLNTPSSPVWNNYPSEKKVAFWNVYLEAKNSLNQYLNVDIILKPADVQGTLLSDIRKDITERPDIINDNVEGTGFDRDIFVQKFKDYYEAALNITDAINTLIRWSAVELGKYYNDIRMDVEDGIVVTRNDNETQTILNASEGISIAKSGTNSYYSSLNYSREGALQNDSRSVVNWQKVFYVDTSGNIKMLGSLDMLSVSDIIRVIVDQNDEYPFSIMSRNRDSFSVGLPERDGERFVDSSGTWWRRLYVDSFGNLYANDLTANRLILKDPNGDVIIDANSGFLDLNKFKAINGSLKAGNIIAGTITADEGFIADLCVNRLRTLDMDNEATTANYIDIKEQYARWVTGTVSQGERMTTETLDEDGQIVVKPLFWIVENGKRISTTTSDTGVPAYKQIISNPVSKLAVYFDPVSPFIPKIRLGQGDATTLDPPSNTKGVGYIYKHYASPTDQGLLMEYLDGNSRYRKIRLDTDGVSFTTGDSIAINFIKGSGNFAGPSGSAITFTGGQKAKDTSYAVIITPTQNSDGFIGEWWVENRTQTGFTIKNTGTAITSFSYVVL